MEKQIICDLVASKDGFVHKENNLRDGLKEP
jgi:hypothetical protein